MRENENASHAEPKASASFALRPQRRVLGFFVFCFVLVLFLFLFSLGCQPISWCCPYIRWAFLLSESSLETLSQSHPEVCLLGDSKSSQVASEEEPSQSSGGRLCHWTDED